MEPLRNGQEKSLRLVSRIQTILAKDATGISKKILEEMTGLPKHALSKNPSYFLSSNTAFNANAIKRVDEALTHIENIESVVEAILSLREPNLIVQVNALSEFKKDVALRTLDDIDFDLHEKNISVLDDKEKEAYIKQFYKAVFKRVMDVYEESAAVKAKSCQKAAPVKEEKPGLPFRKIRKQVGEEFVHILKNVLKETPENTLDADIRETCRKIEGYKGALPKQDCLKMYWNTVRYSIETKKCIMVLAYDTLFKEDGKFQGGKANLPLQIREWKNKNIDIVNGAKTSIPNLEYKLMEGCFREVEDGKVVVTVDGSTISRLYPAVRKIVRQREKQWEDAINSRGNYLN